LPNVLQLLLSVISAAAIFLVCEKRSSNHKRTNSHCQSVYHCMK
jgi:hypothetical protein